MAAGPGEEIQLILPSNQGKPGIFSEFELERSSRRWLMRPSLAVETVIRIGGWKTGGLCSEGENALQT